MKLYFVGVIMGLLNFTFYLLAIPQLLTQTKTLSLPVIKGQPADL
jgi:hypothetical protein